jgi:membrane associated rhomboid family serine protease
MLPQPPRVREPILNLPVPISISIVILLGIQLLQMSFPDGEAFRMLVDWGVVPARWSVAYGGFRVNEILAALPQEAPSDGSLSPIQYLARYVVQDEEGYPWTALTYAFLHGSWAHVIINSVWLAAVGTPMVRRCGTGRFLALSAAAAIGGAVFYTWMNPLQVLPLVGASGAISGLMAAASWFIFAPATWHPEGRITQPHERPRQLPGEMIRNRQVLVFLGVWFAANYVFAFIQPIEVADASIAWEAHVGGFLVGLALFPFLDPVPPKHRRASA